MKSKRLHILFLILMLFVLVLPATAFPDGELIDHVQDGVLGDVQQPAPATAVQLGPTFLLISDPAVTVPETVLPDTNAPAAIPPQEQDATGQYALADQASNGYVDITKAEPDALNACTNRIQNGGFEANSSWSGSPPNNVRYSPYPYQGARSLYKTTANTQNAFLWQTVALPAQAASMFVRIKAWQNMDPGESVWVSVYNADNTTRLWWKQISYTQGMWFDAYWWLPQQQFAGQTVNLVFEMYHDGDNTHSNLWLDNIEFATCDTPPPPATTDTRAIDITISLYRAPSIAERASYEAIFKFAADAIYEMTNGKHYLRKVTFYQNGQEWHSAHVRWTQCQWPKAHPGGYARRALGSQEYISMGDIWPSNHDATPAGCANPHHYLLTNENARKIGGYVFAHEMGHYFYGLYDEYATSQGDVPIQQSVMTNQGCALSAQACSDPNYLRWLNFSNGQNFNVNNPQHRLNAQYRGYGSNAWHTLLRSPWQDPAWTYLNSKPRRAFYPELAGVAPQPGTWPTIELPGSSATARLQLDFHWPSATSAVNAEDLAVLPYAATVYSLAGDTIPYPQPALIVAQVAGKGTITRAQLTAQVTAPNGGQTGLVLRDDGIAPDYIAGDGRYSGIMPYNQNGTYAIHVQFTNVANQAVYTNIGYEGVPWELGELVGESFTTSAETTFIVSGYTGDDHSDGFSNSTIVFSDNASNRGQIDRAGDRDMFKSTLSGDGTFVLRLSSFALGTQPRIRLWQSDGKTLIGDWSIFPEQGYYYFIRLTGPMGASFYTEISHVQPQATQGMYALSFGLPLKDEEVQEMHRVFLPMTLR
jgi:hypothetical protein